MRPSQLAAAALPLLALAGGCGPSATEIGQSVLWAAPIITLAALGLAAFYARLWRPLVDVRLEARPALAVMLVQVALALLTLVAPELDGDLIGIAVWAVGASYLAMQIIVLRLTISSGRMYSWAMLVPWMALYPPALLLGFWGESLTQVADHFTLLWLLPGYGGWVTGPVFLLAVGEVVVRRVRRARAALPAQLPAARVHSTRGRRQPDALS